MFCLDDRSSCLQDACNNDDDDSSKHAWPKPSFSSLICVHVPWSSIASYIFVHGGVRVGTTSIEFGLKISSQQKLFQRYYLDFFFFFFLILYKYARLMIDIELNIQLYRFLPIVPI